jgi:hypothetical protein
MDADDIAGDQQTISGSPGDHRVFGGHRRANTAHFSRAFRAAYGIAPSEWRDGRIAHAVPES